MTSDEELVGMIARRDEGALRELFRRYAPFLLAMSQRMGLASEGNRFVQDVFVRLWDDARRFDPVRLTARTWIVTTAHRLAINRIELVGRENLPPLEVAPESAPALGGTVGEGDLYVSEALDRLDPLARQLLDLAYFGGFDHQELVGLTGRSPATVKTTMRRALATLREALAVVER